MKYDWPALADEARMRWERNATFWDDHMGEANNSFHNERIRPATEQLLDLHPEETRA